jgi:outer membrane protein OmpA-like peptidoglycan-associated protein
LARRLDQSIAIAFLLAGIAWTVPIGPGQGDTDPAPAAYSAADPAEFEITSYRGTLHIDGHARSRRHEQRVVGAARRHFPAHSADFEFHPLGVAPAWWDDATVELVTILATMESPYAYLTEGALRIRALVSDKPAAERRLQAFRQSLPLSADIDVQLAAIDANATVAGLCERRLSTFRAGPVGFEESGVRMRSSAYPALDKVVALANACRMATVTITGHTDSTGNEHSNQQLSLARASAVAAYLESRGVAMERLVVVGAGSSVPIGDNATQYGRSINRRIDIRFTARSD